MAQILNILYTANQGSEPKHPTKIETTSQRLDNTLQYDAKVEQYFRIEHTVKQQNRNNKTKLKQLASIEAAHNTKMQGRTLSIHIFPFIF